ncbi:MAG TPA: RT0821/Lpp0805 family surface protein [Gammaproteobacteria bacterium]|nr:RT0821/Lpp0805 family surface protein [Gammaproteobacteria bacterium]
MHRRVVLTLGLALFAATLVLAGCASKEQTGAVLGAGAGAAIGHQFGGGRGQTLMTIAGAIGGALAGSAIGKKMDDNDRQKTASALENTPTGQTSTWTNPDTGQTYAVTPTNTTTENSEPCRTFVFKSYNSTTGQPQSVTQLACRQPNGTWQIQSGQ